jgi:hypothetical protein
MTFDLLKEIGQGNTLNYATTLQTFETSDDANYNFIVTEGKRIGQTQS